MIALTHDVTDCFPECELTHVPRHPIDLQLAREQLAAYRLMLQQCGVEAISVSFNQDFADAVFVEDTAVVLPELIVQCRPGVSSRVDEVIAMGKYLAQFKEVRTLPLGATLEGGDVLVLDRKILIGNSARTNQLAIDFLAELVAPWGYQIVTVDVRRSLHLKTALCALDTERLLINPAWINPHQLAGFELIEVDAREPFAANLLRFSNGICMAAEHPYTAERIADLGYSIKTTPISEFMKAEGGLTCLSLFIDQEKSHWG